MQTKVLGGAVISMLLGCASVAPPPPEPAASPELARAAPSQASKTPPTQAQALSLEVLEGGRWTAHDPESAWYRRYRFDGDRYRTDGYPVWQESGRVELVDVQGRSLRLRFVERVYDGQGDDAVVEVLELAKDGASFTMGGLLFVHEDSLVVAAGEPPPEPDAASE
jgi:hypothetical protein